MRCLPAEPVCISEWFACVPDRLADCFGLYLTTVYSLLFWQACTQGGRGAIAFTHLLSNLELHYMKPPAFSWLLNQTCTLRHDIFLLSPVRSVQWQYVGFKQLNIVRGWQSTQTVLHCFLATACTSCLNVICFHSCVNLEVVFWSSFLPR